VRLDREYVIAVSRNVTERKGAEDRLREFERVVENLEEMIVVINREYRYVIANRAFLRRLGLAREDVIGRPASEIMTPGLFDSLIKQKLDECFEGKIVTYALKYRYPELGERDLSITYLPV
jgi:PAS domain S-box-containing protein